MRRRLTIATGLALVLLGLLAPEDDRRSTRGSEVLRAFTAGVTRAGTLVDAAARDKPVLAAQQPLPSSRLIASDTAATPDPLPFWGMVDCDIDDRSDPSGVSWFRRGGDPRAAATGEPQRNQSFRRITVVDGDNVFGRRCELGLNDRVRGPTTFYREGDHLVTFVSLRLPDSFPLDGDKFQLLVQMKQVQPSQGGGGTPVIELDAYAGSWRLRQSASPDVTDDARELWSAPAQTGRWTRFAFDVVYSKNPERGSIRVLADLNADGDFSDPDERSSRIRTFTLKREAGGGSDGDAASGSGGDEDGIVAGAAIPSHLRAGIYHHPSYSCPPPSGCTVDIDNVQVIRPRE